MGHGWELTTLDAAATMVYDAFDRRVEETKSATTTEILYGANGGKFGLLNGGTVLRFRVPLPGGGIKMGAIHNAYAWV